MELPKLVAFFAIFNILIKMKQYNAKIINPTKSPHSSTIIGKIKSVWLSGKYRYFWLLWPRPAPKRPPSEIAINPLHTW